MLAGCEFVQAVKSDYTYYTQNAHGDVVNLTDNNGAVTKTYQYDAFGVEKNIDDADTNAFRYCGEYYDKETATIYLRARYYSPSTGRFISRDSFAGSNNDPLSLNLYTYCHNNPVSGTDSTGHFLDTFFDAASLAFDIVSFCIEPTPMGAVDILTDVVGLVTPGVPSAGLKVGVHAAETAYDAYKAVDTAHDLSKAADVAITVSKKGDTVLELADAAKDAKKASSIADGAKSSSKVLTSGKPHQIHHFATNKSKKYTPQFEKITKKYNLDLDGDWNKMSLPHQGRHPYAYHDYVLDSMKKYDSIAKGDQKKFLSLYEQTKTEIANNPEMLYKNYWKKRR